MGFWQREIMFRIGLRFFGVLGSLISMSAASAKPSKTPIDELIAAREVRRCLRSARLAMKRSISVGLRRRGITTPRTKRMAANRATVRVQHTSLVVAM